jgi:hypothetical protein
VWPPVLHVRKPEKACLSIGGLPPEWVPPTEGARVGIP